MLIPPTGNPRDGCVVKLGTETGCKPSSLRMAVTEDPLNGPELIVYTLGSLCAVVPVQVLEGIVMEYRTLCEDYATDPNQLSLLKQDQHAQSKRLS